MSFFDELPEPEPPMPRVHHPWDPPVKEFPGIVQIDTLLLGRTGQVAVAITGMSGYAAGFEIFTTALRRTGAHRPGDTLPDAPGDLAAALRSFRFGLQLSDGTKVISDHGKQRLDHDSEPTGPILRPFLSGGGPRSYFSFTRWWAWPLPPEGPLEFVCEWPIFGLAETRIGVDAQLILDAARRSVQPWPDKS